MTTLYVLFDRNCVLCTRAAKWLEWEPSYLSIRCLPSDSIAAVRRFPTIVASGVASEVIVIADTGEVYRGDAAWLMCLYALRRYRPLAMRLARPGWRPMVKRAIAFIGRNRHRLSWFCGPPLSDVLRNVAADIGRHPEPSVACGDGSCNPPPLTPTMPRPSSKVGGQCP